MTTIPQRLRAIAGDLDKSICRQQASMSAGELLSIAAEIEQSARALLSASQEDAEHAAMYRWLRDEWDGLPLAGGRKGFDAAIRAAMSAKESK